MAYTDIDKPSDYFDTKLYTATASDLSITGLDFAPNWIWIKSRNLTGDNSIFDSVRGTGKQLQSNTTGAEFTTADALSAFNSDGFSITGTGNNYTNRDGRTYASWNWKAGTSFTNDASATGIGSIDSTGSVNTDAGFSIISYTGIGGVGTVAHGLGVTPSMVIIKSRTDVNSEAQHWIVYHKSLGNTNYIWLSRDIATGASALAWNDTSPTSSVISLGNGFTPNNYSSINYIAYCFAEKKGYSKFGSYSSNSNADGPFVYLGFKPAFVIVKCTTAAEGWAIMDSTREPTNDGSFATLDANGNSSEGSLVIDFLSNGFKPRQVSGQINKSGSHSYIFMAFAEQPFVTSTGVPATAR